MRSSRVALLLFVVFTLLAIAPIRSYDLFWHLAAGRWVVEHRGLPAGDPFAVGSDRTEWVNHAWVGDVAAYGVHALVGANGLSIVRGVGVGGLFAVVFVFAARKAATHVALALTCLAFAGAMPLIDVRPSSVAALFVVLAIELRLWVAQAVLAVVWINVHASALLAPVVSGLSTRRVSVVAASAVALLMNPWGYKAITAPIALLSYVGSGEFVNAEWLPSAPAIFPLLYIAIGVGILLFATAEDRRAHWWRVALFVLFAFLAVRHVRHQPLFFAAFPLVVAPAVRRAEARLAYVLAAACLVFALVTNEHGLGLLKGRFPVSAVARLKASGLRGNIYNADQFGGYLIWSFYPERRVLTDGRNELYHTLIPELERGQRDSRAWRALLRKYRIDLAVDEYRPPLEVIDATTGRKTRMSASLAYWPRKEWALIAYDEAAMVFARRAAFAPERLARLEIRR